MGFKKVDDLALGGKVCLGYALVYALAVLAQMIHLLSGHLGYFQRPC